ncbi:MAG: thioredoxin family protein [Bacteroidota bacterium]
MNRTQRFERLIRNNRLILILFYKEECTACETMEVILKIVRQRLSDRLPIARLNVAQYADIAKKYQAKQLPLCLLFKDGELIFRQSDVVPSKTILALYEESSV